MSNSKTEQQFRSAMAECRALFADKLHDYGASWRILRPSSLTDQLFIKAKRIRSLEVTGKALVNEGIRPEFVALVNYGIVGLIQLERGFAERYIPAGTFGQFPEDARTAYLGTSLIVSESMDEKVAYTLTKVLCENIDTLAETCPTFKGMTLESAVNTSITVVPLHPGSVKYFQDIGILDTNGDPVA